MGTIKGNKLLQSIGQSGKTKMLNYKTLDPAILFPNISPTEMNA